MWKRKKKEIREHARTNEEGFLKARSSSPLWNGLVVHHKDVFVSHVISKLNTTDRWFFKKVNRESWDVLAYAGVDVSYWGCLLYTSPSPRDGLLSRMPSSA